MTGVSEAARIDEKKTARAIGIAAGCQAGLCATQCIH
ncbi:hypothetical protein EM595_2161 [Duffyella gerundensis]|uniref:Uncharacterized protein n=1 Tax=Duffyella gerundensis TaxID=1619313 RepID=A0A0U5L5H0_9GAMM|nr:hypothetical protein EM595_2161 [Duffyella gerundensis]